MAAAARHSRWRRAMEEVAKFGPEIQDTHFLASYDFNGDLTDTLGSGPDLVELGGTISGGRYSFSADQGLKLSSGLPSTTVYAIEMKLQGEGLDGYFLL
jgi:hypothetical protein